MKNHIIEFMTPGTKIHQDRGFILVKTNSNEVKIPTDDIEGAFILGPDISITTNAIAALMDRAIPITFTDSSYMPNGVLLTSVGNRLVRQRTLAQISLTTSFRNRIWQKLVTEKIHQQSIALEVLGKDVGLLNKFKKEVSLGDAENLEAQAARIYWRQLFGSHFTRDPNGLNPNAFLNYGYAILRNSMARSIVSAGLSAHFGVFHDNQENPFCLVDDLMEPFRPIIDRRVFELAADQDELLPQAKRDLISTLNFQVKYRGRSWSLRNALDQYVHCFLESVMSQDWRGFETNLSFEMQNYDEE